MDFSIEDVVKNFRYVMDAIKRVTGNVKLRDTREDNQRKGTTLPFEWMLFSLLASDTDYEGHAQLEECSGYTDIRLLETILHTFNDFLHHPVRLRIPLPEAHTVVYRPLGRACSFCAGL